MKPTLWKEHP